MQPLVSVILVTKDRVQYLNRFLLSLFEEIDNYNLNIELIVIDGGSKDSTVNLLKKYDDRIAYWISEPDNGVAEAVNKGMDKATGEFYRLAGDDDFLYPGKFKIMIDYLSDHKNIDWLICHADWFNEDEKGNLTKINHKQPNEGWISFKDLIKGNKETGIMTVESALFRPRFLKNTGGYNDKFYLWAYWEFWLRQIKAGAKFYCLSEVVMKRINTPLGATQLWSKNPKWIDEMYEVVKLHGGWYWLLWHKSKRINTWTFFKYLIITFLRRLIPHKKSD